MLFSGYYSTEKSYLVHFVYKGDWVAVFQLIALSELCWQISLSFVN